MKQVSVSFLDNRNHSDDDLTEEDKWICKANCLHLAAKYFPEGLQTILSHFEQIEKKRWSEIKLYATPGPSHTDTAQKAKDSLLKIFISEAHKDDSLSPLHIASSNPSSLSTR